MQDSLLQYFGESEISFDHFVIKTPSGSVLKDTKPVRLEPQVFTFLLLLIRHKDHIVSRDEIIAQVWMGKKASDDAIRSLVKKLRIALGDNARAPKFLKTVPLQGYLFIMPVHIEFNQSNWWQSKYVMYGTSAVAIISITLLLQAKFGTFNRNENKPKRDVLVSTITQMKGAEVSPYLSKNERLLFSHRGINDTSLQLYVKDLNAVVSKRVTWDSADYVEGIFSSDASQAIVKRKDGNEESLILFNFDANFNVVDFQEIKLDNAILSQRINAISYSQDDNNLYLFDEANKNDAFTSSALLNSDSTNTTDVLLSPVDNVENEAELSDDSYTAYTEVIDQNVNIQVQAINFGLIRYNIESTQSVVLAFPVPKGSRVIDAKESADGEFLGVLIRDANHADIYIQELNSKETKLVKRVPWLSNSLVWAADNSSITFSTEGGELLNLNIAKQRLYSWGELPVKASEVVSQCGEYCFVIKEREADLINIVERPFVFNNQAYISTNQFSLTSNDRFPQYFGQTTGIYFLSLCDNVLAIKRYVDGKGVESIYELPRTSDINSLVLSPNENLFAGELDGRIFLYNLNMRTFMFLTSTASKNTNPVWITDDIVLYQQAQSEGSVIYAHDVVSNKVKVQAKGLQFIKPVGKNQWLLVDEKSQGYLYKSSSSESDVRKSESELPVFSPDLLHENMKFADLDSISSSGFHVLNDGLFFISHHNGLYLMNRVALDTGELESRDLGRQSVLPQFDIHPNMQKMLLVESSLAQSNLLKVDGLTLTTRQINQVVTETPSF
ncbi:MAG: DNA-binding winged helix-turn-helix (wHTH) protein [Bermanella sp.]